MANGLADDIAEEMGTNHWYVTQHLGARTTGVGYENHAQWQGKVYTNEEMETVCGEDHPSGRGFNGYNCAHRKIIFIPGVSVDPPPVLNMDEMERVYALKQKQNRYARDIREVKRSINALSRLNSDEADSMKEKYKKELKRKQKKMRDFVKLNSDVLKRDYAKEKVFEA